MRPDLGGDRGAIELTAPRTGPSVGPMLGDDGGQLGKFGDLMPARRGIIGAGFDRQRRSTASTDRGAVIDDRVDSIGGQPDAIMTAMPGLTTGLAAGGGLANRIGSVERIGRWGRGAIGRIALKLDEEFFDLSFKDGDPSQSDVVFTAKLEASRAVRGWSRFGSHHRIREYGSARQDQGVGCWAGQNRCRDRTERLLAFNAYDALRVLTYPEPVVAGLDLDRGLENLAMCFDEGVGEVAVGSAEGMYPLRTVPFGFMRVRASTFHHLIHTLNLSPQATSDGLENWNFFGAPEMVHDIPVQGHSTGETMFSSRLAQAKVTALADPSIILRKT